MTTKKKPYIRIEFDSVDFHSDFKIHCAKLRVTMKERVMQLIEQDMKQSKEKYL